MDSSTARLIMRRRASLLPFFTFVRFGAHSRKTLFGKAVASLINGNRLLPGALRMIRLAEKIEQCRHEIDVAHRM